VPKRDIRMSEQETDNFLRTQTTVTVIALVGDAAPEAAVGRFEYRDGNARFTLSRDDPVVSSLATDDRACCVLEQFPSYYEIKSVMLHGRATLRIGAASAGEATFDLAVVKVVTFDFGKLQNAT